MVRTNTHNNENKSEGTNAMKNEMKKELITPARAQDYLDANLGNRPISQVQVRRWAQVLHEGAWRLDAGTISFDRNNILIDGQHRLAGIVEAGIGAQVWVQRGCDPDSKYAIDSGRPRTRTQILAMDGVANASLINGAVAEVMQYELSGRLGLANQGLYKTVRKFEHIETHNRHAQDPEAWQEAAHLSQPSYRLLKGQIGPTPLATVAYLMLRQNATQAFNFFQQLSDEAPAGETIRALRRRLKMSNCKSTGGQRELWYLLLAWDSFTTGREIKQFPRPELLRENKRLDQLIDAGYPFGHYTNNNNNQKVGINK